MKKFLALSFFVAVFGLSATFASAQYSQQNRTQRDDRYNQRNDRNWRNNRVRIVTKTRIVRQRNVVYRETIQIKYLPNGRTQTKVIKRVRVR